MADSQRSPCGCTINLGPEPPELFGTAASDEDIERAERASPSSHYGLTAVCKTCRRRIWLNAEEWYHADTGETQCPPPGEADPIPGSQFIAGHEDGLCAEHGLGA